MARKGDKRTVDDVSSAGEAGTGRMIHRIQAGDAQAVCEVDVPFHEPGARHLWVWGVPREMESATATTLGSWTCLAAKAFNV